MRVLILFGRVRFELAKKPVDPQARGRRKYAGERSERAKGNGAKRNQSGHPMPIFTAATSKD